MQVFAKIATVLETYRPEVRLIQAQLARRATQAGTNVWLKRYLLEKNNFEGMKKTVLERDSPFSCSLEK